MQPEVRQTASGPHREPHAGRWQPCNGYRSEQSKQRLLITKSVVQSGLQAMTCIFVNMALPKDRLLTNRSCCCRKPKQ